MKTKLIILFMILTSSLLYSEVINYDKAIRNLKGVKSYSNEDFENSEKIFEQNAIKYPTNPKLHYNQANSQVKNGKLEEAEQNYKLALNNDNFKARSKALQNMGNVKFLQKDYKNAIKNFRESLIEDPQNTDARYNYELAAKMLQRQQQQKQQQDKNKNDQDKKDEEKNKQKQKQDKQDDEQKEQEQKQDEQKQDEKQKSQEQKMKEQKKEDAEKILKALMQKEKEEMQKEKEKMNVDRTKTGKYW